MSDSITYLGISLWDDFWVDFEHNLCSWESNMLGNRHLESSISDPGGQRGLQGILRVSQRVDQPVHSRFLGSILRWFFMPETIKFREHFKCLKNWTPGEDFNGFWARPSMADMRFLLKYFREIYVFHFLLIGFRESNFQVCVLKMVSKSSPKRRQNDVKNEVGNRVGNKCRMARRFPGFGEAFRRLLGSQWEGKRGG